MNQLFVRMWRLTRTRVFWSWRFHSFGPRSSVGRCRLLRHPDAISIGHHTSISDDWSLVDLKPSAKAATPKIRIGNYCTILHDFQCNAATSVELQDYVLVAPRVFITDSDHIVDASAEKTTLCPDFRTAPVLIEHNCWLAVNCVVLKGVRIGHHSIIGANAVVTKDVPPFSTVVGVPGKCVVRRPTDRP
jgi:acetyltransferase-like isoleucine patch superfamily enzyme